MLTFEQALTKTRAKLADLEREASQGELVVLDEFVMERPRGWVFHFNTRRWAETRHPPDGLIGNGPIFVDSETGDVHLVPSGRSEAWLDEYDRTGTPPTRTGEIKWVGSGPAPPLPAPRGGTPESGQEG